MLVMRYASLNNFNIFDNIRETMILTLKIKINEKAHKQPKFLNNKILKSFSFRFFYILHRRTKLQFSG